MSMLLSAALFSTLLLTAFPIQDDLPSADSVLDAVAREVGAAEGGFRSLVLSGRLEIPGMAGAMQTDEVHVGAAVKQENRMEMAGMSMAMTMGSTGTWCWTTDPALGIAIREGVDAAPVRRMFAIFRGVPARELYESAETVERKELEGRPCLHLALLPKERPSQGTPRREAWYVDAETHRLVRIDIALPNPEPGGGLLPMQFVFSDWERVAGLLVAKTRRQVVGVMALTYRFERVEVNGEVAPERAAPPQEVRAAFDDPERERGPQSNEEIDLEAIRVETLKERPAATIRVTIDEQDIAAQLAVLFGEIGRHVSQGGGSMAGPPFTRYHGRADGKVDMEAGIPLKSAVPAAGRVLDARLPGGRAAVAWHVGPYQELRRTYARLEQWMAAQGLQPAGAPWEVYWTDPGIEPDPQKWRTQVLWPVGG